MKVSIFTPTHKTKYLKEVYESIKDQPFDEWVIVYNNGAQPIDSLHDERIKNVYLKPTLISTKGVGQYKKIACGNCTGDILVELDHDDLLMPNAIEEVRKAFEDESVGFVYSNSLYTNMEFGKREKFNPIYGWKYRETPYKEHILDEPISWLATPASVSRIWFAPDHLRAFRKTIYDQVGGHNADLKILDDQDLMCRMYQVTKFHFIDKGLYIYRVHEGNTWIERNKEIQESVMPMYDTYIEKMAWKWADDNSLKAIDLGGRLNKVDGYISVDLKDADIECDLNERWPFEDSSVGVVRAYDVFEHLKDSLHTMKELYRVLAPGGYAFIQVPSTDGRGAFQDPTHVSLWNENSFLYYTHISWAQYIMNDYQETINKCPYNLDHTKEYCNRVMNIVPLGAQAPQGPPYECNDCIVKKDTPVRFQPIRLYTSGKNDQQVCWVTAHLVSLKNNYKLPGIISI